MVNMQVSEQELQNIDVYEDSSDDSSVNSKNSSPRASPLKPGNVFNETLLLDLKEEEYHENTYTVDIVSRPAGLFWQGDVIVAVSENTYTHNKIIPMSKVTQVGNIEIKDTSNFGDIFKAQEVPFVLHLRKPKATVTASTTGPRSLSKQDLISLMMIYAAVFIDYIASLIVLPLLPYMVEEFGASSTELAYIYTAYNGGAIIGGMLIGLVTTRFGTKGGIIYSMLGTCGTLIWCGLAKSYTSLLFARIVGGLSGNSVPVALTFIGLKCPVPERPRYMSYIGVLITLSLMIGPLIGGALSAYGLSLPFFFGSGVAGVGLLATLGGMENTQIPQKTTEHKIEYTLKNKLSVLQVFFLVFPYTSVMSLLGPWLILRFDMAPNDLGNIFASHGVVVSIISIFIFPQMVQRIGLYGTFTVGVLLHLIGYLVAGLGTEWWLVMLVITPVVGGGYQLMNNSNNPMVDQWTTPLTKTAVLSLSNSWENIANTIGPLLWGVWLDQCDENDQLDRFWLGPAVFTGLPIVYMTLTYLYVFRQALAESDSRKTLEMQRRREHPIKWKDDEPKQEHYEELGRKLGEYFTKSHYSWSNHVDGVMVNLKRSYPPLPTRSVEAHLKGLMYIEHQSYVSRETYDQHALSNQWYDDDDESDHSDSHPEEKSSVMEASGLNAVTTSMGRCGSTSALNLMGASGLNAAATTTSFSRIKSTQGWG